MYDSSRAVRELGWRPEYTFERAVEKVTKGEEWKSELTRRVGRLGYHAVSVGANRKREDKEGGQWAAVMSLLCFAWAPKDGHALGNLQFQLLSSFGRTGQLEQLNVRHLPTDLRTYIPAGPMESR